ncbi:BatD family protein [Aliidiomarina soli]|uniref:DUF7939 domain-containing protein n=1 Tax=Aliidiomarina soli TaxID=1928574 RepID=A0A432WL13_9GAMM|nr:BatD family protein [Aliidiomarina soli]RUO34502.1 hypothetical protein CWE14_00370 [Aliidiomarina soli]
MSHAKYWLSLTLLAIALLHSGSAFALTVNAEVDKNPVIVNESFTLTITASDDLPRNAFRNETLLRDFVVGATSVDRSTRLIQGQMSRQTRWQVTLVARRPGSYRIPAFDIDGQRTSPIQLEVIEASESENERGPVFVTARIDDDNPYIQQQVRYTVRLHLAQVLESGSISPPEIEHADIQQSGNDEETQQLIDGTRYRVIERTYFITPRRSGAITIGGSRFDGQIRDSSERSFASFSRPQSVTALAPDIEINVQPQVDGFDGRWLPSKQVVLNDELNDQQRFIVGEPITRHITLTAQGVRDEQLPDISTDYPTGLRYYAERTERESYSRDGERIAQATFRGVILPSQAGTFELPAVEVSWWDVDNEQVRTARIESREITVHAPAGGMPSPSAQPADGSSTEDPAATDSTTGSATDNAAEHSTDVSSPDADRTSADAIWQISSVVLLILWLLTLLIFAWFYWRTRHRQPSSPSAQKASDKVPAASRKPLQQLKVACRANQPQAARQALLAWVNSTTERHCATLDEVSNYFASTPLTAQLNALQEALYRPQSQWQQGDALWQSIQLLHRRNKQQTDNHRLPSLYPTGR